MVNIPELGCLGTCSETIAWLFTRGWFLDPWPTAIGEPRVQRWVLRVLWVFHSFEKDQGLLPHFDWNSYSMGRQLPTSIDNNVYGWYTIADTQQKGDSIPGLDPGRRLIWTMRIYTYNSKYMNFIGEWERDTVLQYIPRWADPSNLKLFVH